MLVATFEKLQGQTLLSAEVCSFGYWAHVDKKLNGYTDFNHFAKLMSTFDYPVADWTEFEQKFPLVFKYFGDDMIRDGDGAMSAKNIVPFDVFRYVYLERNL